MCLGESTTIRQWPPFLEDALNQRHTGIQFSVIDDGIPGITTSIILERIESNINKYHPNIVVTMMGINDWGTYMPYEIVTASRTMRLFTSCRIYKLTRLLWLRILTKVREEGILQSGKDWRHLIKIQLKEACAQTVSDEDTLKKAIELNPKNDSAYEELGWLHFEQEGKLEQAEDLFKKAIELNPKNERVYRELGWLYLKQGKLSEAEDLLKKAIKINPRNDLVYGAISTLYKEMGQSELAEDYAKKIATLRLKYYNYITVSNYRNLKEILGKRGIRLVCVEYPMRSIEPLKKIFEGDEEGVIFVDNEKIFRDAVKKEGYREYFTDMFGGDFGHCTDKGNRLLAENIAKTILKEVFGE
ncbi:MAG: tetratricopeptide repeat protein [Candidatus Omnitrophica bacterium]|nr:tetratricopeptide repeat protein [Candidatus Omnitrophota bacterium]